MRDTDNKTYDDIIAEVKKYITNQADIDAITKAYNFAAKMHEGQYRKSGEPYVIHIAQVAYILATLHVGPQTIIAGLLHDVIEDTDISKKDFVDLFGENTFNLVDGVTKIGNLEFNDLKEYQAENHRKIFIAMANDIRVIIIKLVDRLHNMRTLEHMSPDKQKRIAQETLDVYAPIAHRLGMFEIKNELEDLCFFYLDRERYYEIAKMVETRRAERDEYVEKMILGLKELLKKQNIEFDIFGRSKHLYSINRKMKQKNIRFDEILDLLAIRVITNTELECYEALGYIHQKYTPVPGRLKDYIAMPKFNMYQSLHTTVVGNNGNIFEVQIRTKKMDDVAENGVAAHWRYKEGSNYNPKTEQAEIEEKLHWFRDLIDLKDDQEIHDATEFMEHLQDDLFNTSVYVMSPQGRVIDLPMDATPIDFAYRIHTEIGHKAVGAVVNGSLVPLNTKLKTGDVVQIKTSKQSYGPNQDWLSFVKTSTAKSRIKSFLNKKEKDDREPFIEKGKAMYRKELEEREIEVDKISSKQLFSVLSQFSLTSLDDFYHAIGSKSLSLPRVMEKISKQARASIDEIRKPKHTHKRKLSVSSSKFGVRVEGLDSMMINLGQCCYPVRNDDIVGYITKGKGVTIHRENCANIADAKKRLISCEWIDDSSIYNYESILIVRSSNRNYLLTDVVTVISQYKASLNEINSKVMPDQINAMTVANLNVTDLHHLNLIITNLRKIDSVYSVVRKGEV
ncbi:MAG: bifunctional (p)ppGpp synthetase/guanosine-3',5'-bis(diphosphate) 3'-pyrophosphohydrolase [Erysipelothrix sp.]|nr:bifunctional (p)ppGpp synthetase/guanosine-3',5'-bis(diphosphate) 3'-pyrophosphohydrolase [Erysipelothrix sp.]